MNEIIDNSLGEESLTNQNNGNSDIAEIINGDKIDLSEKDRTNKEIGEILSKIKNPESIKTINLSYNQLSHIPDMIFTFTNLETLDLTYNNISYIPKEIGKLKNLKKLILTSNPLENNPLAKEIAGIGLEYLEIDNLNEDDEYLRDIIPEIKENRIDTFGDDNDDGNRG